MECINFNNKLVFIKKNLNENKNHFIERCWYVIDKLDKEQNNLQQQIDSIIMELPNLPLDDVPEGKLCAVKLVTVIGIDKSSPGLIF